MASTVLDRAVLELGVDASKLYGEAEKALKGFAARVKSGIGKDLKSAFSGLDDVFSGITGKANPLADSLGTVGTRISSLVGGLGALGPVAGTAAVGLAAIAGAGALIVGALAGAAVAIYKATTNAADAGDELNTLSNKFGLTAEAISEFKFIAAQADVPIEAITSSIFKLGVNVSEGGKKTQAGLKAIGSSLADVRKMSQEDAFKFIVKGLGNIPDAGKRAAAGVALFGKQYKEIAQLTREDMDALAAKARESGAVMSQEFAVAGDRFNDAMAGIGASINGVVMRFGEAFLPMGIALAETFGTNLTRALTAGSKGVGDFSSIVARASVLIGQSLAAIVSVGAGVVLWFTEFFAGRFIGQLLIVDKILAVAEALLAVGKVASQINPLMAGSFAHAEAKVKGVRATVQGFAKDTIVVAGTISKYATAVKTAADQTGIALPAAIAKVRKEIKEQADAARKAIGDNTGFGESLGEDVAKGADKAAEALKKLKQEMRETLGEIRAVGSVIDDFGTRFDQTMQAWDTFEQSIPILPMSTLLTSMTEYSAAADTAAVETGLLEDAFKTLGITSQASLQKTAAEAKQAYIVISQQLGKTHPDAIAAFKKWEEAAAAAAGKVVGAWDDMVKNIGASLMAFADTSISLGERAANAVMGIFGAVANTIMGQVGKLAGSIADKLKGVLGGGMLGGLLGGLVGQGIMAIGQWALNKIADWIGGLINKPSMKANDLRDVEMTRIAGDFGGTGLSGTGAGSDFSIVAAKLHEATGSNALFERFLKADTPEQFAAALRAVNAALDAYKAKTDAAADATEAQKTKVEEITAAHKERMEALQAEMASLNDEVKKWDELEAPEEVMGTTERLAREKIAQQQSAVQAAMDAQQQAAEEALKNITDAAVTGGAEAGRGISDGFELGFDEVDSRAGVTKGRFDDIFKDLEYDIRINFVPGDIPIPPVPQFDGGSGGVRDFGAGTLAMLHGREEVRTEAQIKGSDSTSVVVVVMPHGGTVRDVLNVLPKEAKRNEAQFGAKLAAALVPYGVR